MTADTIIRRRLAAQHLVGKGLADAVAVVRELSAVQSQDYAGAKWALSQRIAGAGAADAIIEQEIDRGAILRTHLLRPTWHFVAPEDLRWILALTGHRVNAVMGRNDKEFGLSDAVYAHSQEVMAKALSGGKHLTRTEIKAAMERAKIRVVNGQALARLMMRAEQAAVIVSGARRGKQFTYALVDERVKPTKPKERDEALGELM
ncbi:MAG TPA: crosslink repair DNA glycosylase YcaQ family protein, partial [Gemmatimonadaceae bacterium]